MLYFVIPLKSRSVAKDWHVTQCLLKATLQSVCAQTSKDFHVLVIGHEKPEEIEFEGRVEFVELPFPSPGPETLTLEPERRLFVLHSDKGRKLLYGLKLARERHATFTMFVDADDFVSNRLNSLCEAHPDANGFEVYFGYRMDDAERDWVYRRRQFSQECGSSHIVRTALAPFPETLNLSLDLEDYFIRRYVTHAYVASSMAALGHPLMRVPFYGAIYLFNPEAIFSGEYRDADSAFRRCLRKWLKGKRVTQAMREEFLGITKPTANG